MRGDTYSQMVALLKVVLPLAALGLLSTLFLLSRPVDTTNAIPFANDEIQERLREQRLTEPFFSGATADGEQITFSAETLTTRPGQTGAQKAEDVSSRIVLINGDRFDIISDFGFFDLEKDQTDLVGNVTITSTSGYVLLSDLLIARMTTIDVFSPGAVEATTPIGDLDAGQMHISALEPDAPVHMVFSKGVKLVYQPTISKD